MRSTRFILTIGALAILASARASAQAPAPATLVMPFDNPGATARIAWLGEGSAILLSELIERYGARAIARDDRLAAFDRLQLPPAAALSHATMIKVGTFVGASHVVIGSYTLDGDALTLRAREIRLEEGRLTPEIVESGPLGDVLAVYDRVARRLQGATAAAPPPPGRTLLASPQAVELYVKGLVADAPSTQRRLLEQASQVAPGEDRIRLALWQVHTDAGDYLRALDAVAAVPATSLHARVASYLRARSQIELKRYDEAFSGLKKLESEKRSAEVFNALGVVQLRRGPTAQSGTPAYYFSQAAQADPSDADYFFNLGYAHWLDKDPPAAVYWLREAVRRDPADGAAHLVLAAALQQSGATAEAARERELAVRLAAAETAEAAAAIPRGLERLKDQVDRPGARADAILATAGQRDQAELAMFHLEAGRRAYERGSDREAERELRRALYLSPYLAEAHLLLGRIHLRTGRTADALQAFKVSIWSGESAAAYLALAEAYLQAQNPAAARDAVERALRLEPGSAEARALRDRLPPPP